MSPAESQATPQPEPLENEETIELFVDSGEYMGCDATTNS